MQSILTIMAIESIAPQVRTVAEVNNPRHEPHFRRAEVDELIVTSKIASHLLARSALYPGLSGLVTDIVSGGEGSELYRITLPDEYIGLTIDEVSARLRRDHLATLLSVNRYGRAFVNPDADFVLEPGDDGVTKMLIDPETERILGVGICGAGAGELIAEAVVAMEMGATAEDIALTVHPHPTLSETIGVANEVPA